MQPTVSRTDTVARLAALCRGEISAVETYNQALVREHLLPQQVETHRIVSTLKHSLS